MKVQRIILSLAILLTTACSDKNDRSAVDGDKTSLQSIFSNRPVEPQNFVGVILLSNPPLLKSATRDEKGKIKVDEDLKKAIIAEQTAFLEKLKQTSPQVKVIYQYRLLLNGFGVVIPAGQEVKLQSLPGVKVVSPGANYARPTAKASSITFEPGDVTSVNFIGADKAHDVLKITGAGQRVGIIDTGIDYTHAMLGGEGTEEAFKAVNPALPDPAFPNKKVIGGYDFAGTKFNANSDIQENRIPQPDSNPIDEGGHGTHVAGTVAGLYVNKDSYAGVAPDAELYALKVFGKDGSTSDTTVVAALEYAADPNQDLDISDRLDVVNLSLGGGFGAAQNLYQEAVANLTRGGTVVVASAGNSGDVPYIVGAPSTADKAFSIAASIDGMKHNWQFKASRVTFTNETLLIKAVEGTVSKPIEEAGNVKGSFVYVGLGNEPLSEEVKTKLQGQIALLKRGVIPFADKVKFAKENGAIGAVVFNNAPGEAFPMGGDGKTDIPAIMITLDLGNRIVEALKSEKVEFEFDSGDTIKEPELIDTITDFSSKGPRSEDNLMKPEIAAPGQSIVSAAMGKGKGAIAMSGTSMSGPHMAGVMTLLKQAHPTLTMDELKSLAMGTAKPLVDVKKQPYPLSRQGAGRVQVVEAIQSPLAFEPASISLGLVQIRQQKTLRHKTRVKNVSAEKQTVKIEFSGPQEMSYQGTKQIVLEPNAETYIEGLITLTPQKPNVAEWNASLNLQYATGQQVRIPILAMLSEMTEIKADKLVVFASSEAEGRGAAAQLTLENTSPVAGVSIPMNLIGLSGRKDVPAAPYQWRNQSCDLESVGYRIVERQQDQILQFGFKLYNPVTTWDACEISVLIDGDNDGIPDQELAGMNLSHLQADLPSKFASLLIDATKAREIRAKFEQDVRKDEKLKINYQPAIIAMNDIKKYELSTFAMIEVPLKDVKKNSKGVLRVKIATTHGDEDSSQQDDYLFGKAQKWKEIDADPQTQVFKDLPEEISIPGFGEQSVYFSRGQKMGSLILYSPRNPFSGSRVDKDSQQQIVKAQYSKNK